MQESSMSALIDDNALINTTLGVGKRVCDVYKEMLRRHSK